MTFQWKDEEFTADRLLADAQALATKQGLRLGTAIVQVAYWAGRFDLVSEVFEGLYAR